MKLDSDTMTAKQRAIAAIRHEIPDRVPTYVMGIPNYSKCFKEYVAQEDVIFEEGGWGDNEDNILLSPLGDLTMKYYFGADVEMHTIGINHKYTNQILNNDNSLNSDPSLFSNLKIGEETNYVDYFGKINGIKILPNGDSYNWYIDGYLKKKEDAIAWYDEWGWPGEKTAKKANVQAWEEYQTQFADRMYLIPQLGGMQLYESTWVIMGQARWGYYCRKDPEYIHQLINSRKEAQLKMLDEIKRFRPVAVFDGDDMGQKGRPMLSPAMYRKFFKEPYQEIFDKIHDMGAIVFNHSCGNIVELLPDMIEAGLDGWQSLEPASMIDHAALKHKFGDKLLLVGGLDSREISFGSKESIEKHVTTQIKKMGSGGGYICGPTHDFLTETPLENCLFMRDAIQTYGKYPL